MPSLSKAGSQLMPNSLKSGLNKRDQPYRTPQACSDGDGRQENAGGDLHILSIRAPFSVREMRTIMPNVHAVKPTLAKAVSVSRKTFAHMALGLRQRVSHQHMHVRTCAARHVLA